MLYHKNASGINSSGAFFVGAAILAIMAAAEIAEAVGGVCQPPGVGQLVAIKHIYDGDTLLLKDGRRVRLIGVNTPELGRDGKPDDPFAQQARQAVVQFLKNSGHIVVYPDKEIRDKYGRHLVYLFKQAVKERPDGAASNAALHGVSLGKELLTQGLAFHIAVPPNLHLAECFAEAEIKARSNRRGIWGVGGIKPISADGIKKGGYQRILGKVVRVAITKKGWWIDLDGVTAVIYPEHQHGFDNSVVRAWQRRQLRIEGWVYQSSYRGKAQWRIKLETPYAVTEIP